MALNLPNPDTNRLPRSPLELVVCQVRFDKRLRVGEAQLALDIQEDLGGADGPYPQLGQIEGQELMVSGGPGVDPQTAARTSNGWRLASETGDWLVTLMPDHVSLETTRYTTWAEDFKPRLSAVFEATAKHVQPALEQRLGLRYVDRIEELELKAPRDWEPYISPQLLGPILHPALGESIIASGQQLALEIDEELRATLRHGPVSDGETGRVDYLLDYDIFRQGGRRFDVDDLMDAVEVFNVCALQLFQASVTEKLFNFLSEAR